MNYLHFYNVKIIIITNIVFLNGQLYMIIKVVQFVNKYIIKILIIYNLINMILIIKK